MIYSKRGKRVSGWARRISGFTLVELMIAVAVVGIVASIAVPKVMSTRISSNEGAALATLRTIASAQSQIAAATAVDTDADGGGEFAFLGELCGAATLRVFDPLTLAPTIGTQALVPPALSAPFGDITVDANGHGVVERNGYYFKMWLPGPENGAVIPAVAEQGTAGVGGAAPGRLPDPNNAEVLWCCYAWPVEAGVTGRRTFFVNQEGDLLQYLNADSAYDGIANAGSIPSFDAAFDTLTGGGDIGTGLGLAAAGIASNDGRVWSPAGN